MSRISRTRFGVKRHNRYMGKTNNSTDNPLEGSKGLLLRLAAKGPSVAAVITGLSALSYLLLVSAFDVNSHPSAMELVGFFFTTWAFLLALLIYTLTANDTQRLLARIDRLTDLVNVLAPEPAAQSTTELEDELQRRADHVGLFEERTGLTRDKIVAIQKPPKAGNPAILITTIEGRTYSVYRGRAESVTELPHHTSQSPHPSQN